MGRGERRSARAFQPWCDYSRSLTNTLSRKPIKWILLLFALAILFVLNLTHSLPLSLSLSLSLPSSFGRLLLFSLIFSISVHRQIRKNRAGPVEALGSRWRSRKASFVRTRDFYCQPVRAMGFYCNRFLVESMLHSRATLPERRTENTEQSMLLPLIRTR